MSAPLVEPTGLLDDAARDRYARQLALPGIGETGQRRLAAARVLVVGAGGLGTPALAALAAAGVGTIGVVDDDVVETTNLHRQLLHGTSDVGRPKTTSAREAMLEINPTVTVREHRERLTSANADRVLADYDVVVDGSDNFATRYLVADAAERRGIPTVWGAVLGFTGQVSVFWPPHGPAYRDLHPDVPEGAATCQTGGVLGMVCHAVGAVLAAETVKLVTGAGTLCSDGCCCSTRSRPPGARSPSRRTPGASRPRRSRCAQRATGPATAAVRPPRPARASSPRARSAGSSPQAVARSSSTCASRTRPTASSPARCGSLRGASPPRRRSTRSTSPNRW
ncbi:HesA/MoeB/ThiF family protein [Barrientosiimonas endolithica]|uniref:THIF-type NAD/FAD binding fold domain-containing protein n=1 Tax=Barrientosiimonas endolithica TaxID=1535208 RepID=A0ABN6YSN0_9MICO|nr:ThiF family adenylyltransferase [Barrientosiimonas endolithica]BDZ60141.1 hypothetical protein GCM10025872_37980 [Barrientosiimonas endolithica]